MSQPNTQKIGVTTATIIGMNAMIGAGIFSITSLLASKVGAAGILTYLFAFIAVWLIGLSLARTATVIPKEGAFYAYTKNWGGHTLGLISAGAYLVGLIVAMGLLAQVAGDYLHPLFPALSAQTFGFLVLAALVILNIVGVVLSEFGQYVLIVCTVFPLITTTLLCFSKFNIANLTPFMPHGPGSIITGTKVAIFGLFGFEAIPSLFNVITNPEKNLGKAVKYTLLSVGGIYLLFIASIILSIPLSTFSSSSLTIPQALQTIFPNNTFIINLVGISILSAILGTIHSMIWASSELFASYVKYMKNRTIQNLIHKKIITQKSSVLIIGLAIFTTFATIHNKDVFFSLTTVNLIFAYLTSIMALLFLPKEWKSGQNIVTVCALITTLVIFGVAVHSLLGHVGIL